MRKVIEKEEFKEKFKESVIKKILEDVKIDMDDMVYEDVEELKKLDENGNYDYINVSFQMYSEVYQEDWETKRNLEKEVMEEDNNWCNEIKDLEKYLEMSIKDYIELKTLEREYKTIFKAEKEERERKQAEKKASELAEQDERKREVYKNYKK